MYKKYKKDIFMVFRRVVDKKIVQIYHVCVRTYRFLDNSYSYLMSLKSTKYFVLKVSIAELLNRRKHIEQNFYDLDEVVPEN
ncbi:hypothetical protein A5880_002433 [Enterococcus sp. 4G2_DIV0659]|uniref:Uncharacterized protein n=1 Tax=Candidatus Enterococcus mansonii TaxID=1834181 RepID=A0ABU8IHA3_9ENTE